jgi:uncharacterized protein YbjT (DUF2867 family)
MDTIVKNYSIHSMTKVLITGSTGYVGSRLIQALSNTDHQLICTARNPTYIQNTLPKNAISVQVDFNTNRSLESIFQGCEVAFFLMHSLGEQKGFEDMESAIAQNFAQTASASGVKKIIYLGGLIDESEATHSPHMRSRQAVGNILRKSKIPVIEFRASVILGPGSTSFELIRALVERLPIMVTPKWVRVKAQPIFIDDVISYLIQSIENKSTESKTIEIGGADVVSYQSIMENYAKSRHLRRYMIPIPFLTPYLSSLWLGLVTPVYARVGRKLIDSITSESIVTKKEEAKTFNIKPLGCYQSIEKCLVKEDTEIIQTKWSTALSTSKQERDESNIRFGNRIIDIYKIKIPSDIKTPFKPIEEIGGKNGWYYLDFLWKIRGFMDLLCGGIGLRRGRIHSAKLSEGDPLDWWRVEKITPNEHLRLKAEMKLPGRAWLDFELIKSEDNRYIQQTVIFDPLGLFGLLYWYCLIPIHWVLFKGMLKQIIKKENN